MNVKKLLALVCCGFVLAIATGCSGGDGEEEEQVAKTSEAMTSWWCYKGTCCAMSGEAVTRNCSFGCGGMLSGEVTNSVKFVGCGTR